MTLLNGAAVEVLIEEVSVDSSGRVVVRPSLSREEDFELVYRAGMGVYWDAGLRCLVGSMPRDWTAVEWFHQIVRAVASEYGRQLVVSDRMRWTNVSDELREKMRSYPRSG